MATDDQPRTRLPPKAPTPKRKDKGRGAPPLGAIIGVVIAVIIVAAALSYVIAALNQTPVRALSGQTTVTLYKYPSLITYNGTTYMAYFGSYTTQQGASVYITRLPVFVDPEYEISLQLQKPVRVAIGSTNANLQLELVSTSTSSIEVYVTPIGYLSLSPNTTDVTVINTSLSGVGHAQNATTTAATTTISQASSTTVTTTTGTSSTTTVSYNTTVMSVLETDQYYPLMANYSKMFANSVNCTSLMYNLTYRRLAAGNGPPGYQTYENVSQLVPYRMNYSITNYNNGISIVTYSTLSHSATTTGRALIVNISRTYGRVNSDTITGSQLFFGNASTIHTYLNDGYSAGNACDAYFA